MLEINSLLETRELLTRKLAKRLDAVGGQQRWSHFGRSSHCAVQATGNDSLYVLDSGEGQLLRLDPPDSTEVDEDGAQTPRRTVIWADPERHFLKGLTVVDGVAYFGLSEFGTRAERARMDKTAEVVAVRLADGKQVFRREVMAKGLLNVVAVPQLSPSSTYREVLFWNDRSPGFSKTSKSVALVPARIPPKKMSISIEDKLAQRREINRISTRKEGDYSSIKDVNYEIATRPFHIVVNHVPEPLLAPLDELLSNHPEFWDEYGPGQESNAQFVGRSQNIGKFKPGVSTINLMFSNRAATDFYSFPFMSKFHSALYPILHHLLSYILPASLAADPASPKAPLLHHICRLQLSKMEGNSTIRLHQDRGKWAEMSHRLHVPIRTSDAVHFEMILTDGKLAELMRGTEIKDNKWAVPIPTRRGEAFEINNVVTHRVSLNEGADARIELVIDWMDKPHNYQVLVPGARCKYLGEDVECPAEIIDRKVAVPPELFRSQESLVTHVR